jgi:hypothetical protein
LDVARCKDGGSAEEASAWAETFFRQQCTRTLDYFSSATVQLRVFSTPYKEIHDQEHLSTPSLISLLIKTFFLLSMMSLGHHRSIPFQDRVPLGSSIRNHPSPRHQEKESEAPLGEELVEVPWVAAAMDDAAALDVAAVEVAAVEVAALEVTVPEAAGVLLHQLPASLGLRIGQTNPGLG